MRDYASKNQVSLTKYKAIYDRLVEFVNRALTSSLNLTLSNSLKFLEAFFQNYEEPEIESNFTKHIDLEEFHCKRSELLLRNYLSDIEKTLLEK